MTGSVPSWITEGAAAFTAGSGQSLGGARGTISIDTSRLERDKQVVIRTAKEMGGAFTDMGRTAQQMGAQLSRSFQGIQGFLGLMTSGGLAAAMQVKSLGVAFSTLSDNQSAANDQMRRLRDMATRLNQPFLDVADSARGFLTITRSTNADLETMVSLAQRLKVVDPTARTYDTSVALREFVSGNIRSLVARFEGLQPTRLRSILAEADGDVQAALEGLSAYLTEIGASEEALMSMGSTGINAFGVMRSEVTETMATAFEPLLNQVVLPLVAGFGNLAKAIREADPALLQFAGTMAGLIGASGAIRSVDGITRMLGLGGIRRIAPLVGRASAGIAGVAVAQQVGQAITPQGSTANQSFQGNLGDVAARAITTLAVTLVQGFGVLQKLLAVIVIKLEELGTKIQEAIGNLVEGIGNLIVTLAGALNSLGIDTSGMMQGGIGVVAAGGQLRNSAQETRAGLGGRLQGYYDEIDANVARTTQDLAQFLVKLFGGQDALDKFTGAVQKATTAVKTPAGAAGAGGQFSEDQIGAWVEYQTDLIALENEAGEDRQQAAIDRDKQLADAEAKIAKDQTKREADTAKQLAKSREKQIAEAAANEQDIQEKYAQKAIERERKHRENLLTAAAQLDAWAVWKEIQSNNEQKKSEDESKKAELDRNKEQLDARLLQEQESAAEQLQAAKESDAEYLNELRDRLNTEYNDRITQIDAQLNSERQLREQAFIATYNALATEANQHASNMLNIQTAYQGQAEAELAAWWGRMASTVGTQGKAPITSSTYTPGKPITSGKVFGSYAAGGYVSQDMMAQLHRGEYVMSAQDMRNGGGRSMGDLNVYVTEPGASAEEIGRVVRSKLAEVFAG